MATWRRNRPGDWRRRGCDGGNNHCKCLEGWVKAGTRNFKSTKTYKGIIITHEVGLTDWYQAYLQDVVLIKHRLNMTTNNLHHSFRFNQDAWPCHGRMLTFTLIETLWSTRD